MMTWHMAGGCQAVQLLLLLLLLALAHLGLGDPLLPSPAAFCPSFAPGVNYFKIRGTVRPVLISAALVPNKGPIAVFWHGSNGDPKDAGSYLGAPAVSEILAQSGIVAAPYSLKLAQVNPWDLEEGSEDSLLMDEIVGCAAVRMNIDPYRIYAVGFGMGGLMVSKLSIERSNYLASVVIYSGGIAPYYSYSFRNPNNQVSALMFYGGETDIGYINFEDSSWRYQARLMHQWPFNPIFMCNHNQGHTVPPDAPPAAWEFLKAYVFDVEPNPYANGLPDSFPSYCQSSSQVPPVIPATNETSCHVGTYLLDKGNGDYICEYCPQGSFSNEGSTSVTQCACMPGFTGTSGADCHPCGRNTYKSVNGTESCSKCPEATVSYGGASIYSCMCLAGYVGVDGGPCHLCPKGSYKNLTGAHPCEMCPENTSTAGKGSTFLKQCTCKPGYFGEAGTECYGVQYLILGIFIAGAILLSAVTLIVFVIKRRAIKAQILKDQAAFGGVFNEQEHSEHEDVGMEEIPASPTTPKAN